jgi:hypothetical protein
MANVERVLVLRDEDLSALQACVEYVLEHERGDSDFAQSLARCLKEVKWCRSR